MPCSSHKDHRAIAVDASFHPIGTLGRRANEREALSQVSRRLTKMQSKAGEAANHSGIAGVIFLSLLPSFLYALFRFSIGVALPEIGGEFNLDSGQAGILVSISLAAATATTGLAGYLSDRLGEKRVITGGLFLYSAGLLGILVSARYDLFLALVVLNGLGSGLMLTPTYSVIGRLVPRSRGIWTGALSGVYNIGGFVGPVLTSALLATFGWRTPFAIMGGAGIVVAVLALFLLRVPPPNVRAKSSSATLSFNSSRLSFLRQRNIVIIGAAMFLADLAFLALISWAPTFMLNQLSMPPEQVGFFFGLAIAAGGLGVMSMGYLFDRIGGKRATLLAAGMSAGLSFLFLVSPGGSWLAIAFLIFAGFAANSFWSLLSALAQVNVDQSQIGTATGVIQNIGFVGAMIGPVIAGSLLSNYPISSALIVTVSLPYLIYTLLVIFYKPPK